MTRLGKPSKLTPAWRRAAGTVTAEAEEIVWSARAGAHLEAARKQAGLRRIDLAYQMGVTEETIRLWEKGSVQPSVERLARLIALMALETTEWPARSEPHRRPSAARAAPAPGARGPWRHPGRGRADPGRAAGHLRRAGRPGARRLGPTSSSAWPSSSGSPSRTSPPCAPRRSWSTPPAGRPSASSSGLAARSSGSPAARSRRRSACPRAPSWPGSSAPGCPDRPSSPRSPPRCPSTWPRWWRPCPAAWPRARSAS